MTNQPIPQSSDRFNKFPADLRAKKNWCLWRLEEREGKQTKVPYQPSGTRASSTDPATWATFTEVCAVAPGFSGIGIFSDGSHSFIDLDKCVADGVIEPWAQAVVCRCASYAELSPSGTGVHIFVRGTVDKAAKINGCEIYSRARYFTVTGQHIAESPLEVREMSPAELEELRDDIAQNQLRPHSVTEPAAPRKSPLVITKPLSQSERETKLERALSGDLSEYGGDRSAAVHGALQLLARKHAGDAEKMAEEFEASELCGMWGAKWGRLAESEIAKAIERWQERSGRIARVPAWSGGSCATRASSRGRFSGSGRATWRPANSRC